MSPWSSSEATLTLHALSGTKWPTLLPSSEQISHQMHSLVQGLFSRQEQKSEIVFRVPSYVGGELWPNRHITFIVAEKV